MFVKPYHANRQSSLSRAHLRNQNIQLNLDQYRECHPSTNVKRKFGGLPAANNKQVNKTEVNKYSQVLFTVDIQNKREEKYPEGTARKKNKRLL